MTLIDEARRGLSDHEQMIDAQAQCVPCKLCGGKAVITDAGSGCGYYIACENASTFKSSEGCMLTERRLGGWAYNVMEWWNRLHQATALETQAAEIARLLGLLREAEAGLEDVINPLRKIQRDAAEQGARLSGMAYAVANDLHFVRDIARTALSKLRAEKEDG